MRINSWKDYRWSMRGAIIELEEMIGQRHADLNGEHPQRFNKAEWNEWLRGIDETVEAMRQYTEGFGGIRRKSESSECEMSEEVDGS